MQVSKKGVCKWCQNTFNPNYIEGDFCSASCNKLFESRQRYERNSSAKANTTLTSVIQDRYLVPIEDYDWMKDYVISLTGGGYKQFCARIDVDND